jgi:hypothetical protein
MHRTTGSAGYFGNRASVFDLSHNQNIEPLPDLTWRL